MAGDFNLPGHSRKEDVNAVYILLRGEVINRGACRGRSTARIGRFGSRPLRVPGAFVNGLGVNTSFHITSLRFSILVTLLFSFD